MLDLFVLYGVVILDVLHLFIVCLFSLIILLILLAEILSVAIAAAFLEEGSSFLL